MPHWRKLGEDRGYLVSVQGVFGIAVFLRMHSHLICKIERFFLFGLTTSKAVLTLPILEQAKQTIATDPVSSCQRLSEPHVWQEAAGMLNTAAEQSTRNTIVKCTARHSLWAGRLAGRLAPALHIGPKVSNSGDGQLQ